MADEPLTIEYMELPEIARAASARARHGKTLFLWVAAAGLISLTISSTADVLDQQLSAAHLPHFVTVQGHVVNLVAALGSIFLLVALLVRNYRGTQQLDRPWYASRIMAEEIKSLAWRYAVRGRPFELDTSPGQAEEQLREQLRRYAVTALSQRLSLAAPPAPKDTDTTSHADITPSMLTLRSQSRDVRRQHYAALRIRSQWRFYTSEADKYHQRERWTAWALNGIKVLGVIWAALFVVGTVPIELFGVTSTIVAAATSWLLLNQYASLAATYGMMARLMLSYHGSCSDPKRQWTDTQWADFVAEVEGVLSEEHVAWRSTLERFATSSPEPGQ